MPIYQFVCASCHTDFELMRPFSKSATPAKCPTCKGKAERQITSFACKTGGYLQTPDKVFQGTVNSKKTPPRRRKVASSK